MEIKTVWACVVWIFIGLCGTVFGGVGADEMSEQWLVAAGEARAEIVLAAESTRSQRFAAGELQSYVQAITGVVLPIVSAPTGDMPVRVFIGTGPETETLGLDTEGLEYGAFRIVSGDGWLAFLGNNEDFVPREPWARNPTPQEAERVLQEWDEQTGGRWGGADTSLYRDYSAALDLWQQDQMGSLNAVYHFLKSLGMRWYHPGELGKIVPEMDSIPVPEVDVTVQPDFNMRSFWFWGYPYANARASHQSALDHVRWELWLGINHRRAVLGAGVSGHGGISVHRRDVVKQENPEYFALWAGKRATDHLVYGAGCLSSPGLREENLRYAQFMFDQRDEPSVNLSPADGYTQICQCELCVGKDSHELGWRGQLSNYVWDYVNELAKELYESHPDRMVTGIAYSMYLMPPSDIEELSPNIAVGFCYWRSNFQDPVQRAEFMEIRDGWRKITPSQQFYVWNYYLHGRPGTAYFGVPVYFPHAIVEDLRSLRDLSLGDYVEVYPHDGSMATNHLNCYINAIYLWDLDQDLEEVLDEYCTLYMGPAAKQMREFIAYAEENWPRANRDLAVIHGIQDRWAAVVEAAGDGVYGERAAYVAAYLENLREKQVLLERGRSDDIHLRVTDVSEQYPQMPLDARGDKPFWEGAERYELLTLRDGDEPQNKTYVQTRWVDGSLYLYIRAEDSEMEHLRIGSKIDGDMNIISGDVIELVIETPVHAHYQLAFSPSGALVDLDRRDGLNNMWASRAEVAAYQGDDYWALEIRLPAAGESVGDIDPLSGIAGDKPTADAPWHINICRQRFGAEDPKEMSALSPTGGSSFHDRWFFARLWVEE